VQALAQREREATVASLLFLQEATGKQYVFLTADTGRRRGAQAAGLTVRWPGTA
jgi:hypothetical protein